MAYLLLSRKVGLGVGGVPANAILTEAGAGLQTEAGAYITTET